MELGLARNEVKLVSYTPEWKEAFISVKKDLIKDTNLDEKQIEHIGSTAIIGMSAKPVIDIAIGVDCIESLEQDVINGFKKAGFLRLKVERPGEIVFAKFTDNTYVVKTHFIHVVLFEKELWNNFLFFRDYLNANKEIS